MFQKVMKRIKDFIIEPEYTIVNHLEQLTEYEERLKVRGSSKVKSMLIVLKSANFIKSEPLQGVLYMRRILVHLCELELERRRKEKTNVD